MKYQQVSLIEDLPELEDLDMTPSEPEQQKRFSAIRNKTRVHEGAGIMNRNNNTNAFYEGPPREEALPYPQQFQYSKQEPPFYHYQPQGVIDIKPNPQDSASINYVNGEVINEPILHKEDYSSRLSAGRMHEDIDCRRIFHHIDNCPICKKFYKNDTFYLVIIAALILIIALLLKRVLRV